MEQFNRPSLELLKTRISNDLIDWIAPLRLALSVAWAKALHVLYGYVAWIDLQNSPLTCNLGRLYDFAALYSTPRLDAFAATGNVIMSGNIAATALADSLWRGDNGLDYKVLAAVTLTGGNDIVTVKCTTAGAASNLPAGATLTAVEPMPGVESEALIDIAGLTGGAEQEEVEAWRLRVVDEWQTITSTGARSGKPEDYRAWAKKAHPSVTGALVQLHTLGKGTVLVRPICNGLANRQPTQAILDAISAYYISPLGVPGVADWSVTTPNLHPVDVDLTLDAEVDTAQNRAAITTAINNAILGEVVEEGKLLVAEIDAAIATVTTQYTLNSPVTDTTALPGEIFVLNAVNFS